MVYFLISWHFISSKRILYFNVDKEASASGELSPRPPNWALPWIPLEGLLTQDPCHVPPMTVTMQQKLMTFGSLLISK